MENKVYFAYINDGDGGSYIAAKNIKEAKKLALYSAIADFLESYIDLNIYWVKGVKTNYEGELNVKQLNELGLQWWECPNCNEMSFEIIDDYTFKCKNCGYIGEIPRDF